jgi:4-hydroxyphenylpyruvate dioxygenase-like putative hemolysin
MKMEQCLQVRNMRERGQEFLQVPDTYYEILRERLNADKVKLIEDLDILQVCTIYPQIKYKYS